MFVTRNKVRMPKTFTNTSEATFSFVPATTFATTPATPVFQSLRFTSETLSAAFANQVSNEIRSDAMVSEVRRSGISTSGEIAWELHRNANFEDLLAAAVRGAWATNVCKGALTTPHFTFERRIEAGATDYFLRFEGTRVGGFSTEIVPEEYIKGSFKVMGAAHSAASAIVTGATYPAVAGADGSPMVGADVSSLAVSGAAGVDYLGLTIDVDLNLREQRKIGSVALRGIGYGRRIVTGTLRCYFEDLTAYNLFLTNATASIVATASDGTNSFTFTIPRARITGGEVPNPGNDQDFILTLNWQGTRDSTLGTDIQITRA